MTEKGRLFVCALALLLIPSLTAQEPATPGPEHEKLRQLEGTWDATVKTGPDESRATLTYKMGIGGLWLIGDYRGEFGGQKFEGLGMDTYDPVRKKYVGLWVDSMSTSPIISEGSYDGDGKVLTMVGEGVGPDGKPTKYRMTTEHKDKDTMVWNMYAPESGDQPTMTITYRRRK